MLRKFFLPALFLPFCLFLLSSTALACACCSEPGTYSIRTTIPDKQYLNILNELQFGETAELFMTAAGFDQVKGLEQIKSDFERDSLTASRGKLDLAAEFTSRIWKFGIRTKSGKTGALVLPMPSQMLVFKVDIHDSEDDGAGPILYKELRFKGNVSGGEGFLRAGIVKPTSYFLVFQGRGNNCDSASDFTNWRLEITGAKARYAFFGTLDSGNAGEIDTDPDQMEKQGPLIAKLVRRKPELSH